MISKYYLKRIVSIVFILAVILGGFFLSYDVVENEFKFYYFIFYVVGCIVIIPSLLRIYWYIKLKRESRTPAKLTEVY
ncbi:MAG: hypothetical protein KGD64_12400, partial [Candidatus Heimdallarchaeota archaeon]|nr:hypothetical protein [Candidatus Heimdallarchaeota archaeon]